MKLITNQQGNTLLQALRIAIPEAPARAAPGLAEAPATLAEVCIATAFVSPQGFGAIAAHLAQAPHVRLLLGTEPVPEAWRRFRHPGDAPAKTFARRELAEALATQEAGMRLMRDAQPFTAEAQRQVAAMAAMLRSGRLETRRYGRAYLHAKATLIDGFAPQLIVGSSNLTRAGLTTNLELNLGTGDPATFTQARAWFDALWDEAEPYDLAALFEEPEREFPPWLIFMRMLWQLYGDDLDNEPEAPKAGADISLARYQEHGLNRARRILREYGGVLIADEVGLGKTFMAGALMNEAAEARQRVLLICPAQLRDTTWKRWLLQYTSTNRIECVSFDDLAREQRLAEPGGRVATRQVLQFDLDDYSLVVVDEAHNYRNRDTSNRAVLLRRLLSGKPRGLVLLTATPVNNSLWDLYNLLGYFLRQHGALAALGIPDFQERFRQAAQQDPSDLSPDLLYPVIDAVTVKRTRRFIRTYYANDSIAGPDGVRQTILFPKAVPLTLRFDIEAMAPGLFDAVVAALDPDGGPGALSFARYAPGAFPKSGPAGEKGTVAGLLRSGLLKRFESSAHAFRLSLERMLREHAIFLAALHRGQFIETALLREISADEAAMDAILDASGEVLDAAGFDLPALRAAVERDQAILAALAGRLAAGGHRDPKLYAILGALEEIDAQARADAATDADERRNRKVLIFSSYADTVDWLRGALRQAIGSNPRLAAYRGRVVAVAGGGLDEEAPRVAATHGFAPETAGAPAGQADLYDILVTTDVLAEGVNLQQARHIINLELPWNPMRLVQRHGRIDRIGSRHPRVFLRSIFPAHGLGRLLTLEQNILRKLARAAKSIGLDTPPVDGADGGEQVFAETRIEIEKLAAGDGSIYERGGTPAAAQSGEEYRHRLRAALAADRTAVVGLPGRVGSGMARGGPAGVVFCAEVTLAGGKRRSFLRFVPTTPGWLAAAAPVVRELGTCLRLADCEEAEARLLPERLRETVFGLWDRALDDILQEWAALSDPAQLQPRLALLNRQVAAFLRAHPPPGIDQARFTHALNVLESPWPHREEAQLRSLFRAEGGRDPAVLVGWILDTGLEPHITPEPLPPAGREDVRLVCWLAVGAG